MVEQQILGLAIAGEAAPIQWPVAAKVIGMWIRGDAQQQFKENRVIVTLGLGWLLDLGLFCHVRLCSKYPTRLRETI